MSVSPRGNLAACTDDKGRILLVDLVSMCIVRAWKGYRDVQCGWIEGAAVKGRDEELGMWTIPARQASDSDNSLVDTGELAPMYRCALPIV